jgi:hypothetical protein
MRVEPKLRRSPLDFRPGVAAALATYWAGDWVTGGAGATGGDCAACGRGFGGLRDWSESGWDKARADIFCLMSC